MIRGQRRRAPGHCSTWSVSRGQGTQRTRGLQLQDTALHGVSSVEVGQVHNGGGVREPGGYGGGEGRLRACYR